MQDSLFIVHVSILTLGMACMLGAFVSSWLYLIRQRQLKKKNLQGPWSKLPSLESLDRWAWRFVVLGFLSLTLGIGMGLFLAHVMWPDGWTTDPKVIMSLTTWVWFLLTLTLRSRFGWRGSRFFAFIVVGFILTLVVFFGFSIYREHATASFEGRSGGEICTLSCSA